MATKPKEDLRAVRKRTFEVTLDIPVGVTLNRMLDYITQAVQFTSKERCYWDTPLHDLDVRTVKVRVTKDVQEKLKEAG